MDQEFKVFIIKNKFLLERNNLDAFYHNVLDEFGNSFVTEFTAFFLNNDVNPLKYLWDIPTHCFDHIYNSTRLELREGTRVIGSNAFRGSTALREIIFPKSLMHLGTKAFADCPNLTKVKFKTIPDYIDSGVFEDCNNIKTVEIPREVDNLKQILRLPENAIIQIKR